MKKLLTPSSPLALYGGRPPSPEGSGWGGSDPLVLGHALGSSREMWDEVVPLLPPGLPVILWDQPGHGASGLLRQASPTATDVARSLNNALHDLGVNRAHIAGLSLGGLVSLAYAQAFPEETLSLGILDSGPANRPAGPWREKAEEVERDGMGPLVAGTMQRWFTPAFATGGGAALVAKIRQIFLDTNPAGYAQCCRVLANTDLWGELSKVSMSTLVLTGVEDAGFTPEAAESLARYLPDAGSALIIPHARHLTAVEQPQKVADALAELVAGTL